MQVGIVVGTTHATVKHLSLNGWKLLVVQPVGPDEKSPDGDPVLAIDNLGAGRGERVIITSDGKGTRQMLKVEATPVRWSVLGIVDEEHAA